MIFSESCQSSHRYACLEGDYCCGANIEKIAIDEYGDLCNGSEVDIDGRCCDNDDQAKCGYTKCINHKDAITNDQGNFK